MLLWLNEKWFLNNLVKKYFDKDIMADDGLFILPLGFNLPFNPVDFLSGLIAKYASSKEVQKFYTDDAPERIREYFEKIETGN